MKLIKLSDTYYIIVDDSEINEGDYFLYGSSIYCADKGENKDFVYKNGIALSILSCKKITHSTEPLAYDEDGGYYPISVTAISLSEVEEAINGYSVEMMANEYAKNEYPSNMYTVEVGMPHRGTAFRTI